MRSFLFARIFLATLLVAGCGSPSAERADVVDVRMPEGTVIKDVPKDTTRAELVKKLHDKGYDVAGTLMPGSRGGMVVGGTLNGTLRPPSD